MKNQTKLRRRSSFDRKPKSLTFLRDRETTRSSTDHDQICGVFQTFQGQAGAWSYENSTSSHTEIGDPRKTTRQERRGAGATSSQRASYHNRISALHS